MIEKGGKRDLSVIARLARALAVFEPAVVRLAGMDCERMDVLLPLAPPKPEET